MIDQKGFIEYKGIFDLCDRFGYFTDENGDEYHTYLRGESDSDFTLSCSYFRDHRRMKEVIAKNLFGELYTEDKYFGSHISGKLEQKNAPPEVIYMIQKQHINSGTPLLDLSTDIYAPLYFACKDNKDRDGQIYLFNWNRGTTKITDLFSASGIETLNNRSIKQSSAFALTYGYNSNGELTFYDITEAENVKINRFLIKSSDKDRILESIAEILNCRDLDKYFGFDKPKSFDEYLKYISL